MGRVVSQHGEDGPAVVVGIDGSANSDAALRWAAEYARLIKGELHAVIAWDHLLGFGFAPISREQLEREARHVLRNALERVLGDASPSGVVREVIQGNPISVLVEASKDAALLVVGARGYGGFAGLLLGSVGENCARQAHCPVLIVRGGAV